MSKEPTKETVIDTQSKTETIRKEVKRQNDFWLGFGLSFGMNLILWLTRSAPYNVIIFFERITRGGSIMLSNPILYNTLSFIFDSLPFLINIGVIIYLLLKRPRIAFGMLFASLVIIVGYWVALYVSSYLSP